MTDTPKTTMNKIGRKAEADVATGARSTPGGEKRTCLDCEK